MYDRSSFSVNRRNWPWFMVLGGTLIVAGCIGSMNLLAANMVSILIIAWMMILGGLLQIIQAFITHGTTRKILTALSAGFYLFGGILAANDNFLAAMGLSLFIGAALMIAGVLRMISGAQHHHERGWLFIVISGLMTLVTGGIIMALWPVDGLWILGLLLVADLFIQGLGIVAFGFAVLVSSPGNRR
jgi:uncharacterized membrane protein HdeD (DUF308 family)